MSRPVRDPLSAAGLLVAVAVGLLLAVGLAPAVAGAQDTAAPALGPVLDGEVTGLTATATSDFGGRQDGGGEVSAMQVVVEVTNDTGAAAAVAIPFGTLLATDDEADQTVAVGGPDDPALAQVAASGATPEIAAPEGTSTHVLVVYCTEADDGAPIAPTPLRHLGTALEPLPTVLRAVAAQQPAPEVAQDAVWWVTDDATLPVPSELEPLLADIDTAAFAAEPHRVVPDTGYSPRWARAGILDESFDGGTSSGAVGSGAGLGLLIWFALGAIVVVGALILGTRHGREQPATVAATRPAGWYPDPTGAGQLRWWDGRSWTQGIRRSG